MHTENRPVPVNLIHFHGLHLMVVAHEGVEYVPAKPFAKLACIDWKSARRTLFNEENVVLYGTRVISTPKIWGAGGDITPQEGVFLRLDRARMFLARINTSRMRAHGNSLGADQVLALQIEWAKVLHQYETTGEARKSHRKSAISEVLALQRARDATGNRAERDALTCLLHATMAELGAPVIEPESPQATLPLQGGVA
ncbi:MAG: phage antirepressor N-terminal domain-containing protein [Pseudomonadota bacterium]|nr:phage antirepressor N-terminal domain-containing protein [Pseudomonadota bacterium]